MCLSDAWLVRVGFNPRSRGGSDAIAAIGALVYYWFQSTLPWWERRNFLCISKTYATFQSTLPWWERHF